MANLLTHGLFALALYSTGWALAYGQPLTAFAFLAAFVALVPDVDSSGLDERSPVGHSLGYVALWILTAVSVLTVVASVGLLPEAALIPSILALALGLASHLLLDAIIDPGILGLPTKHGLWKRLRPPLRRRHAPALDLLVSTGSMTALLLILALY